MLQGFGVSLTWNCSIQIKHNNVQIHSADFFLELLFFEITGASQATCLLIL